MGEAYVLFLLGVLQVIMLGIGSWTLLAVVKQGKELVALQTLFNQVMNNRVVQLETDAKEAAKSMGELKGRLLAVEQIHGNCPARNQFMMPHQQRDNRQQQDQ